MHVLPYPFFVGYCTVLVGWVKIIKNFERQIMFPFLILIISFSMFNAIYGHGANEWTSRTIYQVLTDRISPNSSNNLAACADLHSYCGGTWSGIESKLDYISGMGFDAIWISPMPENLGNDYHGYAFLDLYSLRKPSVYCGEHCCWILTVKRRLDAR